MRIVVALCAGLLFGFGLAVAEMVNPAKILNFLDVAGTWDPSLALVLAAAVGVSMLGYQLVLRLDKPVLAEAFQLPTKTELDPRLIGGAAIFGIGWGLGGLCPGPGFASLAFLHLESLFFLAAMALGLFIARQMN